MTMRLEIDYTANAAYLTLHDGTVVSTREVAPGVNVDLDEFDTVLGIEVLGLDVFIPYSELTTRYHVVRAELQALEIIRPNVTSFVARQALPAPDIVVRAARQGEVSEPMSV